MTLERIIEDLKSKPLIVVADPGEGKTVLAKELLYQLRLNMKDRLKIQVFDPSPAWWHDSPLFMKQIITNESMEAGIWRDESHCLYELGSLDTETRMDFVADILTKEYLKRRTANLWDAEYLTNVRHVIYGIEEVQTVFPKTGKMPKHLFDVLTFGRNYKEIIFAMTQRLSECRTGLVERCNVLCGYLSGDNDRNKLRRGTSWEFKNKVTTIKTKSYLFHYYNGEIHENIQVKPRNHGSPTLIHNRWPTVPEHKPRFMPTL